MANIMCECGQEVPQLEFPAHRHVLSARARKAREDQQRRAAAIIPGPRPCEDCGAMTTPGRVHGCPGRPVDAALAEALAFRRADEVAPIVAELERQGWTPPAPTTPPWLEHEIPDAAPGEVAGSSVVDLEERRLWPRLRRGKS